AAVERADVRVGLLEAGVLPAGEGEVGDGVEAVSAAGGPAGHDADDDLGHEADQSLALQDVEAGELGGVDGVRRCAGVVVAVRLVLVAGLAADPLVAAAAKGPLAVLRARAVPGEEHAADVGR